MSVCVTSTHIVVSNETLFAGVAFSRLPGAEVSSLVQEHCSANADCNIPECISGTVVCIDDKCTCMLVVGT